MADNSPGRSTRRHGVSRRTLVIRKAKDEDARRIAERDAAEGDFTRALGTACSLTERGKIISIRRAASAGAEKQTGAVSGRQTKSRPLPGDTLVRYASGRMAIRPGGRRAGRRRRALAAYAAGYMLLFGAYLYFLFTGATTITPAEFVDKSFALRKSTEIADLQTAAYAVMRGNRTPAELHLAQALNFYDENGEPVHVEAGDRLTLPTAARLARAIIEDGEKPERLRSFTRPIAVYRETHLAGLNWPVYLSLYNAFGFFLLLWLFLRRPLLLALGTEGRKTAAALRSAREALEEAESYKRKYREMSVETAERAGDLRAAAKEGARREREEALARAARQAEEISLGVRSALAGEERDRAQAIGTETARRACDEALEILRGRAGGEEHDQAVEELIAAVQGMRFDREECVV